MKKVKNKNLELKELGLVAFSLLLIASIILALVPNLLMGTQGGVESDSKY